MEYFSQPWEYSADILGGVNREKYKISSNDAMLYLFIGKTFSGWKRVYDMLKKSDLFL